MGLLLFELGFLDYRGAGDPRDRLRKNRHRDGRRLRPGVTEKLCISASLTSGFADFAKPLSTPPSAPTIGVCRS
jgi:hypothetical protein